MTAPTMLPFEGSRRLTGGNLFFAEPGAVLESAQAAATGVAAAWRAAVANARRALGWPEGPVVVRAHAQGLSLAFGAPLDQLYTATEVNEWALRRALRACGIDAGPTPLAPGEPSPGDRETAERTLQAMANAERNPALVALVDEAERRGINALVDDEQLTLGSGRGGRTWPVHDLPQAAAVHWNALRDVPMVLVTGSNGKTTTTRLLAALGWAHGWRTAHTSTDGVFVGSEAIDIDDYSGPGGARLALRRTDIDAAMLETARGGMLRRGIAPQRANVAIVTNVSDDHFGEYGIDDLDALAEVKLSIARPLGTRGTLVTNADDAALMRHLQQLPAPLALFALDADLPAMTAHRARGGATAGVRAGRLLVERAGSALDLGAVDAMPLTFGGSARYNIANLAAAALAATLLGMPAAVLRKVFANFGAQPGDNPGRLERRTVGGIDVFIDFAHNPDGLAGLLAVVAGVRRARMGLLMGQAGDRRDADLRELATVAAAARPERVAINGLPEYLRGRAAGEVPAILREALTAAGLDAARISDADDEWDAAQDLLRWAQPGDTLVLPILAKASRNRITAFLGQLAAFGWRANEPLPL